MICILSGLEIPKGMFSREHYVPKALVPPEIANNPLNIYPAIKIINNIKGALYPCQWMDMKDRLCFRALETYKLKSKEREIIRQTLKHPYQINPCDYCIAGLLPQYCIKNIQR